MKTEDMKKSELITDVYRAKRVYESEMKSPEYRAENEEDFEFIGKALFARGYRKAYEVAAKVCAEIGERFKSLLEMLPANGTLTDAKTFIDAHWEFIEHSIVLSYDAEQQKK